MLYLICSMMPSVDLAHYRVSHAKDLGFCEMCYNLKIIYDLKSFNSISVSLYKPTALRKAKIVYNCGLSECNRVNGLSIKAENWVSLS